MYITCLAGPKLLLITLRFNSCHNLYVFSQRPQNLNYYIIVLNSITNHGCNKHLLLRFFVTEFDCTS